MHKRFIKIECIESNRAGYGKFVVVLGYDQDGATYKESETEFPSFDAAFAFSTKEPQIKWLIPDIVDYGT